MRTTPCRLTSLQGKSVTSISLGRDFVIALGLTLP